MDVYIKWLYTAKVFSRQMEDPGSKIYEALSELYVLGEVLIDSQFQNRIIDAFIALSRERDDAGRQSWPGVDGASTIYNNTPASSPMRRLLVDFYVQYGTSSSTYEEDKEGMGHDFLIDLSMELLKDRESSEGDERRKVLKKGVPHAYYKDEGSKPSKDG